MLLDGAFRALLLLVISGASAVIVLPPTNLNVSCKNLKVTASWEYSKQQPPTVFRVDIGCAATTYVRNTTDHQFDLTSYIWASEVSYMDNFCVTVTAEQGSNQSEPVQSKTFSFNTEGTTDITCELDFPPVNLNSKDSEATVSFENPLHFYRELEVAKWSDGFTFKASINASNTSSQKDFKKVCTVTEHICKLEIPFLDGVEKCVTLSGLLFDSIGVGQISFRKPERVCVDDPAGGDGGDMSPAGASGAASAEQLAKEDDLIVLSAVPLSLAAVIIVWIIICICKTKAWTMETEKIDLPDTLLLDHSRPDLRYANVSITDVVPVTLTGNRCQEEDESTDNLEDRSFCSDVEGGFSASSNQKLEAARLMSEGYPTDDDSADSSVKTECVSLRSDEVQEEEQQEVEEEREPVRMYDRAHNLQVDDVQVDMGDGEMITAYLGR
ncbi:interferon gamma receptor 1 [Pagrus major]|uniref:interferon gamma receptor 1 n=1 Tax=Pagrus major TaxID=143350 RepID=UPI003CC8A204